MELLKFEGVEVEHLMTHFVGNKNNEEELALSNEPTHVDESTIDYLTSYFLQPFKAEFYYKFRDGEEHNPNKVFTIAKKLFGDQGDFINDSQSIARLLFDHMTHPKIKSGELNVVYLKDIIFDDEVVSGIGIFKSENKATYLKMTKKDNGFTIGHDEGYEVKGIDKGALILNTDHEDGYKVLIVDNKNKNSDAQFWIDAFLQLDPISNEYVQTAQVMSMAKEFLTNKMKEEFELNKAEQVELMQKSKEYFNQREEFDEEEFAESIFTEPEHKQSFRQFNSDQRNSGNGRSGGSGFSDGGNDGFVSDNETEKVSRFPISEEAVKKRQGLFKSVIKLDKNFTLYVHGDRKRMEQGSDPDGRRYYKLYFDREK